MFILPGFEVVNTGAGGVGKVGHEPAGQDVIEIILGAKDLMDPLPHLRLMITVPHHLKDGVTGGWETIASGQIPLIRIHLAEKIIDFLVGTDVRPYWRALPQQVAV